MGGFGIAAVEALLERELRQTIYLWHMPMHEWLTPWILRISHAEDKSHWFLYASVYLTGLLLGGSEMRKSTDFPMLQLRNAICKPIGDAV